MHPTPHQLSRRTAIRLMSASLAAFAAVAAGTMPASGHHADASVGAQPDTAAPVRPDHRAIVGLL